MRSPNFPLRALEIGAYINEKTLQETWIKYLREKLRKSLLADPLENLDTHINIRALSKRLSTRVVSGRYSPMPPQRMLVEKSRGLCRQVVMPHTEDALILQCLFKAFYADIKGKAPSRNAFFEADENSFSKATSSDGTRYGSMQSWLKFQQRIFNFIKTHDYIIVTDIANYYDCISYDHLRHTISSTIQIKEPILDLMLFTLSGMLWQPDYMPRVPVGLPQIDLDAPRILAHCLLYDLDRLMMSDSKCEFARFMDDIDVGVQTIADAKRVIQSIDLSLQTKQLRLNSGKTKILKSTEARSHFKIRENILISKLESHLSSPDLRNTAMRRIKRSLRRAIDYCHKHGIFDTGNGDKVLKRLIGLATRHKVRISDTMLIDALFRRPSVREAAIRHLTARGYRNKDLELIQGLIESGELVDDASYVAIANGLVGAAMNCTRYRVRAVRRIIGALDRKNYFQLYSRLWLASKFEDLPFILNELIESQDVWRMDRALGRLVGGLACRFYADRDGHLIEFDEYVSLVENSLNSDAIDVFKFHDSIVHVDDFFSKICRFVRAPNNSQRLGVTHPKFLMLLSCLSSQAISNEKKLELWSSHKRLEDDQFCSLLIAKALEQ